jgi:acetylornithine deacetylase/succinyl-diaminopimelate desuccinylase-like protein
VYARYEHIDYLGRERNAFRPYALHGVMRSASSWHGFRSSSCDDDLPIPFNCYHGPTMTSLASIARCTTFVLFAGSASLACAQTILQDAELQSLARQTYPEYFSLLSMPADSAQKPDIQRNVDWLEKAFAARGFRTEQLANDGRPLLFAEFGKADKRKKTILVYMHLDAQPAKASEWATDPWTPTLRKRDARGAWQTIPSELLGRGPIDPEWRVFARAASDDKGPIMMFLAAFDALKGKKQDPAVHVKVLLDSEEEKGSPSLHTVMAAHKDKLSSDGIVVYDGGRASTETPSINFGNRGSIQLNLTVFGTRTDQHSGLYGNIAPNAALRLAKLVAGMKDAGGKVIVPGFYDGIVISEADKEAMARHVPPAGELEKRMGVTELDAVASNPIEALQYPSLDVLWIGAGAVGSSGVNSIPSQATASFNVRTVPETPPARVFGVLENYVTANGYKIIAGDAPTDAERAAFPRMAKLTMMAYPSTQLGFREPMDTPLSKWAISGVKGAKQIEPDLYRMGGSTLPMGGAVSVLKTPYLVVPLINADSNQHGPNENLRLGSYMDGIRTIASMLTTPWK